VNELVLVGLLHNERIEHEVVGGSQIDVGDGLDALSGYAISSNAMCGYAISSNAMSGQV
jgi:hypothetical protein